MSLKWLFEHVKHQTTVKALAFNLNKMNWKIQQIRFSKLTQKLKLIQCIANERPKLYSTIELNCKRSAEKKNLAYFSLPLTKLDFFSVSTSLFNWNCEYALNIAWKHCKFIHRHTQEKHENNSDGKKKPRYTYVDSCSRAMTDYIACTFFLRQFSLIRSGIGFLFSGLVESVYSK